LLEQAWPKIGIVRGHGGCAARVRE
jgi:hypothetical protein